MCHSVSAELIIYQNPYRKVHRIFCQHERKIKYHLAMHRWPLSGCRCHIPFFLSSPLSANHWWVGGIGPLHHQCVVWWAHGVRFNLKNKLDDGFPRSPLFRFFSLFLCRFSLLSAGKRNNGTMYTVHNNWWEIPRQLGSNILYCWWAAEIIKIILVLFNFL